MNKSEIAIRDRLVEKARALNESEFTNVPEANALLNNLEQYPHAFVIACLMDRQAAYEKAWLVPYRISQRLGAFGMKDLSSLSHEDVRRLLAEPEPLVRYCNVMSMVVYSAIQTIVSLYGGNAAEIWTGKLPSAEVIFRFLGFYGAGPKIATMAVNILARDFKVEFADLASVDISADIHVARVFTRLGLCPTEPKVEQIVYKARALCPEFPGILDLPCWEIGRTWCRPQTPNCSACYMSDLCLTAKGSI